MNEDKKTNFRAQKSWEILDKLMKEKGVTAYRIAKDSQGQITTVLFADWKKGKSVPKLDKVRIIADYLGVTTDYIMGYDEDKKVILEMIPYIDTLDELTKDEQEIMECYRKLTDDQKTRFRSSLLTIMLED